MVGHVARTEEGRNDLNILRSKPIGKRPLGRPRHRWENTIRRIGLIQLRIGINWRALVNVALDLRVS